MTFMKMTLVNRRGSANVAIVAMLCIICVLAGTLTGMVVFGGEETSAGEQSALSTSGVNQPIQTVSSPKAGTLMTKSEVYAANIGAVVGINIEGTMSNGYYGGMETPFEASGSGFVISSDGYIMTNNHVVDGADKITVVFADGRTYDAKLVGTDSDGNDVALIKIEATGLQYVTLASEDNFVVGEDIIVVGNPLGEMTFSLTSGAVSTLARTVTVEDKSLVLFQLDAAVNPGNSGGPVFDMYGNVIGMVTAKYSDTDVEGIGFAIPINTALKSINDIREYGYVRGKPYFGITVKDYATQTNGGRPGFGTTMIYGAYIETVEAGSCAEKAGLANGDIITALDSTEITSVDDLLTAKRQYSAGDTAQLVVYRNGEFLTMSITFDEYKG